MTWFCAEASLTSSQMKTQQNLLWKLVEYDFNSLTLQFIKKPVIMLHFLPQILGTLAIVVITIVLKIGIKVLVNQYQKTHTQPILNTYYVTRVLNIIINTLAIIAVMVLWGVDTDNLFLALGSVFAVIGVALFAQWSILSNITSGIILFFSTPFRVGDFIRFIDNDIVIEAKVLEIFTFYTHLRTREGVLHILPNTLLLQKAIAVIESKEDDKRTKFTNLKKNS